MSKGRFALAAVAAALFAACAGSGASQFTSTSGRGAPGVAPVPAPDQQTAVTSEAARQGTSNTPGVLGVKFQSDRVLVLTAQLNFRAEDPWTVSDRIQTLALGLGGDVIGVSQSGKGDDKSAVVTVRVPNERFNDALAQIKGLEGADLVAAQVSGQDMTEQFIDLDARLKAKQQEESRYLALLARADKIDDILKIDQVLSQVRGQIEQLQGQLNALKNRSSMATISTTISTAALAPKPLESGWQPARTFQAATGALLALLRVFADFAIWALVWVWIPLLAFGLITVALRGRPRPA